MRKRLLHISILVLVILGLHLVAPISQEIAPLQADYPEAPAFLAADESWVDSIMEGMSLEEKIGQMIMVQAYSNMGDKHRRNILKMINRSGVGGIAFFQGDPVSQARLTNEYQSAADIPLLVAMDGENGLGMRLKQCIRYPSQMALGAISDNSLLFELGLDMAEQMRRLGVHMNFAPVADVNNNPANPVINIRSFGEDPVTVAAKVAALSQGMQAGGVLATAKHFPGHGDTDTDSHDALPEVTHNRERLDSVEIYPFREAIHKGLAGIMVAHMQVPAIDPRENRPATVSALVVDSLLKGELGFQGLVMTDALNMKGLSSYYEPGRREVEAVKAGNDILLMPADAAQAISEIKKAVRKGEIAEERIEQSCRKILLAKSWCGLQKIHPVDTHSLLEDLHATEYGKLYRRLVEGSLTLVRNRNALIPLKDLEKMKLATLTVSRDGRGEASWDTDLYKTGTHFRIASRAGEAERRRIVQELSSFNTVIVNILGTSAYASRYFGISGETIALVEALTGAEHLVLNVAGYPYTLGRFPDLDHVDAIVLSYDDDELHQRYAMQALFGGRPFRGFLPVSDGERFLAGKGIHTPMLRLAYGQPEDVAMDPDTLAGLEDIIEEAIRAKAIPGCQVLVARQGKVIWHRAYGYQDYRRKKKVEEDDLYDLASITKITATLPALMSLRDQGRFHEDSLLELYVPMTATSDKGKLRVGDILSHQAGLEAWIPFYLETLEPLYASQSLTSHNWSRQYPLNIGPSNFANRDVKFVDSIYSSSFSPEHPIQVAEGLYLRENYPDTIYQRILDSPLLSAEYRYSDLGYYFMKQYIEAETDTMLYPFVWYRFYAPMGAESLGFLPLNRFDRSRIAPTENDLFFRRQLVHGYVHDPGAAMLGGVAGHAGLFGNANDLAKIMQMYLNGGWYGEKRYLSAEVLERFTSCYDPEGENRRGLGFDRPVTEEDNAGPACDEASALSFGHSGFTGTLAWVDPAHELIYIFLSNRIHPKQGNTLLIDENIRTRIQQVVYDAIRE